MKQLQQSELIGKMVTSRRIRGTIVDETRNMLIIEDEHGKTKKIPKEGNEFAFEQGSINGSKLIGRPEERTKRYSR